MPRRLGGEGELVDLSSFSMASAALAHYVTFAHLLGGLMLAAGLLTRLAALVQMRFELVF